MLLAFFAFLGALLWRARPPVALIAFCVAWGGLFFAPTLLGRNEQLYYHNDLVAAAAVLLGASARMWRPLIAGVLVALALNAEVSQRSMRYSWYDLSEALRPLEGIVANYRTVPVTSVVFIAGDPAPWDFELRSGPLVETLFGRPELEVR